jgi:cell division protein FtsQ|tara:strand:+ start:137 stop:805 length:669 start_codon:yes stop_codon:yes gene_type:complete
MILKNKFFFLIFLFIVFTTYNYNEKKQDISFIFPIKKILIEETLTVDIVKLKAELEFLRNTSLFFLKQKKITNIIDKYVLISSIQLKKKYPNTLKILISEHVPVAVKIDSKKKYYLTKNGKKINDIELQIYENLPLVIGNYKNFSSFYEELEISNFKIDKVKMFYYFEIGRWDIELNDGTTIKLPINNYRNILKDMNNVLNSSNFSKYKILDYRIKGQLILR